MTDDWIRELIDEATPGPWRIEFDDEFGVLGISTPAGTFDICETDYGCYGPSEPDARLIVAAHYLAEEVLRLRAVNRELAEVAEDEDMVARVFGEDVARLRAQIAEAVAILEGGTDYERLHVAAILRNGLDHGPPLGWRICGDLEILYVDDGVYGRCRRRDCGCERYERGEGGDDEA